MKELKVGDFVEIVLPGDLARGKAGIKDLIPPGVEWVQDSVTEFFPEEAKIKTQQGRIISYNYLIVAPGLVNDLSLIEGLEEAVKKGIVCSNYIDPKYTYS